MKVFHIIGADLSKKTIDFAIHSLKAHLKVQNNAEGFKAAMSWISQQQVDLCQVMIVMEHTGLYSYQLEQFLHQQDVRFTKISGLAIKRSMGLVRGKTDKQDAMRIAQYGVEKADRLHPVQPTSESLQRLQLLHSARQRLVSNRAGLSTAVKECQKAYGLEDTDVIIAPQLELITSYDKQIQSFDDAIQELLKEEKPVNDNFKLLQSIKGVGKVVALAAIIKTHNFTRFANARKFACFCGTAPFEHSSGTSIRGRTKISHLADKAMKTLLDLAAKSAIQYDKELRAYYQRRLSEGKSKKSTINIVRNKLLARMFAVIKRQTPYQPDAIAA